MRLGEHSCAHLSIYVTQTSLRGRGASALGVGASATRPPLGGSQEEGGHLTLGPDVPEGARPRGDCVCLKPQVTIPPVPYHRQLLLTNCAIRYISILIEFRNLKGVNRCYGLGFMNFLSLKGFMNLFELGSVKLFLR